MALTYFKRFRMEMPLGGDSSFISLPSEYRFVAWQDALLEIHAETKFHAFSDELDADVFPCLSDYAGCLRLMTDISHKPGFLPGATWLLAHINGLGHLDEYVGTVQGICDRTGFGAIQNLGIVPEHRGRGLGTALLFKSLEGFYKAGLRRAYLEVTAQNDRAVRLYRRLGFNKVKTLYKVGDGATFARA